MELSGNGLNKGSRMYFHSPSQAAKYLLFYPLAAGVFSCNSNYRVARTSYDSILALYVLDGSITFSDEDSTLTACQNELLLIDCYKSHRYHSNGISQTVWLHFDGSNSRDWFDKIKHNKGQKIKCQQPVADILLKVVQLIASNPNEYLISQEIYSLLCSISADNAAVRSAKKLIGMEKAKQFIASRYSENLSLEDMARNFNLSATYFSKIFKEAVGFAPYDYLLSVRLEKAKAFLLQTDEPVQNIAFKTGFNSTSNFICFFKKETGMSPLKFRKNGF